MLDQVGAKSTALMIVHVMGYYVPDLGYQENFLPFEQAKLGHDVHIITGDRYAPHPSYNTVYEPRIGPRMVGQGKQVERNVTIHRLPVPLELKGHNNPWIRGSVALLDQLKPDIVHLHGVTPWSSLGVIFSGAAQRHVLVCDHHLCHFNLEPFTVVKRAYYATFRTLCAIPAQRRVKAWLPVNEDAKQVLSDVLGISGENVFISRLGVDADRFTRNADTGRSWRLENNIPDRMKLFVHAGRLEPRKRIEDLIKAFSIIASEEPDKCYWLGIVGNGDEQYIRGLKNLAASFGISARTTFWDILPHKSLPAVFNAADAGIWPGDVSVTLIEALGCGLPIALPEEPGLSYVANCAGVTTFEKYDVAALANLMPRLIDANEPERGNIATECAGRLSWRAIAAQATEIYREVIARSVAMQ
ncbi:MAG: glycosyltransferase family 4 protein [Proteobacteria bacterium]|nr:glycosyltransferase family 4 protein [Pseudomonadota bacterium]